MREDTEKASDSPENMRITTISTSVGMLDVLHVWMNSNVLKSGRVRMAVVFFSAQGRLHQVSMPIAPEGLDFAALRSSVEHAVWLSAMIAPPTPPAEA